MGGRQSGAGRPDQSRAGVALRHPADVRDPGHDRPCRDRAVPRSRGRRAAARRQPLNQSSLEVFVRSQSYRLVVVTLLCALAAGACSGASPASSPPTAATSAGSSESATAEPSKAAPIKLVVGLGYIPSVQFAPFYLARQAGYYSDAGLEVEFQNKVDPDLITLVGQGAIDVVIGDGTSVIPAVSQGIPIKYIATIYGQFPNVVFAKASSGIAVAADLKGKKVGTPGRYGSGWIMLQALLGSAGLTTSDIDVVEYPDYTQRAAVE